MTDLVCYLDMDGVLVDFVGGICKVFGVNRNELYRKWPPGHYDMEVILGISTNKFWKEIDSNLYFWRDLEPTKEMNDVVKFCKENFKQIVLMTTPPHNPIACAQKVEWIVNHLPEFKRDFSITPVKEAFAHPKAILIDDREENIIKFRDAGGNTILYPAHQNSYHMYANDPIKWLEKFRKRQLMD